jgi:hypothetical protein
MLFLLLVQISQPYVLTQAEQLNRCAHTQVWVSQASAEEMQEIAHATDISTDPVTENRTGDSEIWGCPGSADGLVMAPSPALGLFAFTAVLQPPSKAFSEVEIKQFSALNIVIPPVGEPPEAKTQLL